MWQQLHEALGDQVAIVGVAVDAQGPDRPRPYVEKAGVTFPMLIDERNVLAELFGFRAIPNGLLVDEQGAVVHRKFGGFEIREADRRRMIEGWVRTGALDGAESSEVSQPAAEAMALFHAGLEQLRGGHSDEARRLWRRASELDPQNFVVRKQLWAVEHPERFYDGAVDFAWQREQMEQGL